MQPTLSASLRGGLLLVVWVAACERAATFPEPGTAEYAEAVTAFHRGLAAAQVGESGVAEASFRRVTELAPAEPAGWANYGLAAVQRSQLDEAAARLTEARSRAPDDVRILLASAVVALERGETDAAAEHLRRAHQLDPDDPRARYLLAEVAEREGGPEGLGRALELLEGLVAAHPGNLEAQVERARVAARAGYAATVERALAAVEGAAQPLPADAADALSAVRRALAAGDLTGAATGIAFLETALQPLPAYREDRAALVVSPARTELLLPRFAVMPAPESRAAPADTALAYAPQPLELGGGPVAWVRTIWIDDLRPLAAVAAGGGTLKVALDPDSAQRFPVDASAGGLAALDYDYDFRLDLLVAGVGGVRLLRQGEAGFMDVTAGVLPGAVTRGAWTGAWAADLDMEGDVDIVLGRESDAPVVLRNLGDGRFEEAPGFEDVRGLRGFAWADLDADGDPDAAIVDDAGRLRVFLNRRHDAPRFGEQPVPDTIGPVAAVAAADLSADATFDLVLLTAAGRLRLLSLDDGGWTGRELARWPGSSPGVDDARLFVHDLDNNGRLDVAASTRAGTRVWLGTDDGLRVAAALDVRVTDVADLTGEGRLDLVGVAPDGAAVWLEGRGERDYYGTAIRPRAATATGDRRINSFGVGGEIEARAGLLYQKRTIEGPVVHFGLGEHAQVDVARIVWPNGSVQAEFNLAASNQEALTRQRLKGSCPWVFAYDGRRMTWVTDFLWRTALGLRINAQGETAVLHAEDWVLIRGDQLAPRDGLYDIRITAELWETHFFDHVALLVVDHPAGTEVLVDERFTLPAPEPAVHAVAPLRPIAGARDHRGRDVTGAVAALDDRYADGFDRGPYQGVAEEHWIEVDLGPEAPATGPLRLVASGWIYPTDSSINLARAQAGDAPPSGLRLEVPDGRGGWVVAEPDLGFPAGRAKTILIDLSAAFRPGTERRVRLHTDMEIYWDRIAWTVARPATELSTRRVPARTVELRHRGFSAVEDRGRTAPERPSYAVASRAPRWRDLEGWYTRYGDVRALNEVVDDRYVVMNAGDELVLRFPAPAPPPRGWTRDFVLIGDGWIKDGDYNTGFSRTVRPLPYHGLADYDAPPGRLEDDPGYLRHPGDWQVFHTRYVTPQEFHHALLPSRDD